MDEHLSIYILRMGIVNLILPNLENHNCQGDYNEVIRETYVFIL